ncbi:MAG: hypothetical protein J0665_15420 [Deltaproteobacteria bacterium]|nr:hypothetical protein [Deltaproteobacteria bacterium]
MLKRGFIKKLPLAAALLGALALTLESFLSLSHKSLCRTEACEVVGKYLNVSESLLVAGAAVFFWLLAIILFFAGRYTDRMKNYPFYLLALALAVDSSLMGFQFFTIHQKCIFCISIAALLVVVAILYCLSVRSLVFFICVILIWAGGFGVHAIMVMPSPQGAYANMAFYSTGKARTSFMPTPQNKILPLQMTLIMSMNCPHCLGVVSFLGDHPLQTQIRLVSIDTDHSSLARLSSFLQQSPDASNPFKLLHEIKENNSVANTPISQELKKQTQNGANFLNNLGITRIPVLVADFPNNQKTIIVGDSEILSFLGKLQ